MSLRLTASDIYDYYRPSECNLRVYLRHRGEHEAPPGPYEQVLFRLAERHEKAHLATFPEFADLSKMESGERTSRTTEAVRASVPVIYQGRFKVVDVLNGVECEVVGSPDFLIHAGDGYLIRDSKISRRISEEDHPEILRQLELYGWLYEQTYRSPPRGLEVHSGAGNIVRVPYDSGRTVRNLLGRILKLKVADSEHYEPVGWSKCQGCVFFDRDWPIAQERRDIALVSGVDQGLARTLHERGVRTVEGLVNLGEDRLAEIERPWGGRSQRVGAKAIEVLRQARALADGREIMLRRPALPEEVNYVMLDLEGIPPHLDDLEKIYLWGLRVYGQDPGDYQAATAGFALDGDRQGWEDFLQTARSIFEQYGDLPFVHWSHYERTKIGMYVQRYGDANGIAARIGQNLCDLLPITRGALILPLPSYSLKVVEAYVGFQRKQSQAAGDWAMARYVEAVETEDPEQRLAAMSEILAYNREDLAAMWAVFEWLRRRQS